MANIEMNSNEKIGPLKPVQWLFLLLCLGFAWRGLFIYRDVAWITNYWLFEDFGYSLKIAKNIALGLGETFDGVVPTNGYQPLYVWLMVPVFWIFNTNLITPIYIAITLLAIANVATGIFIYSILLRLTENASWALLGVAFWMFNFAVAKNGSNGLEAGLSTMMVAATLAYYFKIDRLDRNKAIGLGLLLGLCFLARVDAIFLVVAVLLAILAKDTGSLKQKLSFGIIVGIGFSALSAPYAIWNTLNFGSPLPTSGQVTTGKSSLFSLSGISLDQFIYNIEYGLFIIGKMLAGAATPGGVVVSAPAGRELYIPMLTAMIFSWILFAATMGATVKERKSNIPLLVLAGLYLWGYLVHSFVPFERYFLPVILFLTILVFSALANHLPKINVFGGIAVILCASFLTSNASQYIYTKNLYTPGWFDGIKQLNKLAEPNDIVAASQSGNLGYFYTKGRAINLDGVVNMNAYNFKHKGEIDKYINQENVRFIADEGNWIFILANQISANSDKKNFLARLIQRHASNDYAFAIYELTNTSYSFISKPSPTSAWVHTPNVELIDGFALRANTPGKKLQFSMNSCFDLKFLRHSWSGIVNIYKDGVLVSEQDLYSSSQDPTYKLYFSQDSKIHTYTLEVSNKKNPLSHGTEIWLDAVLVRDNCKQAGIN